MTGVDSNLLNAAIASARATLGLDAREPARTWSVARMHPGAHDFLLVVFGSTEHASAIAAVDQDSSEVLESAHLPGHGQHELITAHEAIKRAGFAPDTQAQLVWDPSPASRSRFYPLWQLQSGERRVWVDSVRGAVWHTLDTLPRGGGSGHH